MHWTASMVGEVVQACVKLFNTSYVLSTGAFILWSVHASHAILNGPSKLYLLNPKFTCLSVLGTCMFRYKTNLPCSIFVGVDYDQWDFNEQSARMEAKL